MSSCRCITGVVVKEGTTDVQVGVLVRLSTGKGRARVQIAEAKTDKKGYFFFDLEGLTDQGGWTGVFHLAAFAGQTALATTGDARFSAKRDARDLVLCVEWPERCAGPTQAPPSDIAGGIATPGVHGQVQHVDGTGLVGLSVQLYSVGFSSVEPVGTPQTTLSEGWFSLGSVSAGDLYVVASVPATPTTDARPVGTSRVKFGYTGGALKFTVTVCDDALRGPSEFALVTSDLSLAIFPSESAPATGLSAALVGLDVRQAVWLAQKTDWSVDRIVLRALSERLAAEMNAGSPAVPVPAEGLYGLLRQGFPKSAKGILTRAPSAVGRAITLSRKANIIQRGLSLDALRAGLKEALGRALADGSSLDSLGAILATSAAVGLTPSLDVDQIAEFCGLYAGYTGTDEEFWSDAAALSLIYSVDGVYVNEAKRLIRVGTIAIGSAPCVTAILGTPGNLGSADASVLATWSGPKWLDVATAVTPLPDGLDETNPVADLARILQENAQSGFPAQALHSQLSDPSIGGTLNVHSIFALPANDALDLRTARLTSTTFTSTNPGDPATVKAELTVLRTVQRLCRIAPGIASGDAMVRIAALGVQSARDVVRRGTRRFIDAYTSSDPSLHDEAIEIVSKARSQHGMAVAFFGQAAPTLGLAALDFVGASSDSGASEATLPGWDGLFSSPTGTIGAWCQSIHGPSAYLVDLLHWLSTKTKPVDVTSGFTSVLAALSARRPDLALIPLTCENTERVLPYIDLTLECLEAVVVGGVAGLEDSVYSSDSETPEMLAAPQYTNDTAYATLANATNSFVLPFHQPLAEARPFLAHLGIERTDLMRAFGAMRTSPPSDTDIAFEELRIVKPDSGLDAVTDNPTGDPTVEQGYWSINFTSTPAPTVQDLLRVTGLTYPQLLDLLHTRVANGTGTLGIFVADGADPYSFDSYSLLDTTAAPATAPSASQFADLRKVIRLQRATGWTFLELDKVMAALSASTPSAWTADDSLSPPNTLLNVGNFHRMLRMTEVEPVELAAWFGVIDTFQDRDTAEHPVLSLYDQTFLNASVFPASELGALDVPTTGAHTFPFVLNSVRTEIDTAGLSSTVTAGTTLTTHVSRLHAVLGIDESEVTALVNALGDLDALGTVVDAVSIGVPGLTLPNLTRLYRWCSIGRVLGVKPTEAVRFAVLLDVAPSYDSGTSTIVEGVFSSISATIDFVKHVRECQAAGWSIDELDYVLRHENADRVSPTDDYFKGILGRLHDAVAAQSADDDPGTRVDAVVRQLASEFLVDRAALDALDVATRFGSASMYGIAGLPHFLGTDIAFTPVGAATTTAQVTSVILPAGTVTTTSTLLVATPVTIPSGTTLTGIAATDTADAGSPCAFDLINLTVAPVFPAGQGGIIVPDATVVTLADTTTTLILSGAATVTLGAVTPILIPAVVLDTVTYPGSLFKRFLRSEFVDTSTADANNDPWAAITRTSTTFGDDFAVLDGIFKALLVQSKVGATEDERAAWVARVGDWDLLDPSVLWGASLTERLLTGSDGYTRLKHTIDLFAARKRLTGDTPSFGDLLPELVATDMTTARSDLATRTGWDADSLSVLLPSAIGSVDDLTLFLDRMDIVRRSGASPDVVAEWAAPGSAGDFTSTQSRGIVSAARSRYATAQAWSSVARPIRDPVRKAQRDALVGWHIANPGDQTFDDAEDVYQYFLIDVSMNPEMLTSRIVQASCTVQLFIHRCLFGLETTDSLSEWFNDDDRTEWEWMRTYRIWEAARKVFLYPENWIEPELRDDKTPLFTALERELSQGDITADRVEQVTLDYLDRLNAVASLQVLACYVQKEDDDDGSIDYLHVFARSHSSPPTYWYRRREDSASWTAWEKVDAGVQGDQLVAVVYDRRLMLFWGEFIATNSEASGANPASWWEIRLAMSEYRDGKWSAKQVSNDALSLQYNYVIAKQPESGYGFCATEDAEGVLTVSCFVGIGYSGGFFFEQVGTFTLDPCTMQVSVSAATSSVPRIALDPAVWAAPGFITREDSGDTDRTNSLDVYVGGADVITGDPIGTATAVCVLDSPGTATAVVPSQWNDFVSQSPFFVAIGTRTYFVEPLFPDGAEMAASTSSASPPVVSVTAFRRGTTQSSTADPSGVTAPDLSHYFGTSAFGSATESDEAVTAVSLDLAGIADNPSATGAPCTYRFTNFYHPFVCRFIKELRREGVFGLLDPDPAGTAGDLFRQAVTGDESVSFENSYGPTDRVDTDYPIEDVDFDIDGAYSQYNWEIFFHLPYYVANRLADQGRFQDALDYFHTIFDPRTRDAVTTSGVEGAVDHTQWWKVKPFLEPVSTPVTDWIAFTGNSTDTSSQASFETQVAAWRDDPFNPHLLARMRPGTYQRALVMRYIETLIAWGDELFTRDTIETLNEATQLYVFAKQVLGDRPALLEDTTKPAAKTYKDLADPDTGGLDDFGNATVAIENSGFAATGTGTDDAGIAVTSSIGVTSYFNVPFNMKLLSYWDLVADRLFKIRNGMNISGVHRSLPLFQPPIDPAMLVRAAAAGIDIGSIFSGSPTPGNYRFSVMLGRAQALAGSLKALGQAMLSALEKRDAEALALLRQRHEGALFDAMKGIKERSVDEAKANLEAARKTKSMTETRHKYYDKLITKGWLPAEEHSAELIDGALVLDGVSAGIASLNAILSFIPDVGIGFALHARVGGSNINSSLSSLVGNLQTVGGAAKTLSGRLSTTATYKRRAEDWKQQKKLAAKELEQNDKQILAAEIRLDVAKRELKNQELQIAQSAEVNDWMQRKWTNQDLYDWTASQLAALHFQTYQLALATATKAQVCYNHELGRSDTFIQAVYWDSGKKGLLAGERLAADLERMDAAYLDNDVREFELTKHIALSRLDPLALARLRVDGECFFVVPEESFELDSPGHYMRRIQSVALSIAAVTGQQSTVNAQLTLYNSYTRASATDTSAASWTAASGPPSIVTSVATQDSGLFQADLKDPRYLPFERNGAVSAWHLRLTAQAIKQIDWDSITDVVLHMRYTARDGGASLGLALSDLLFGYADSGFTPTDLGTAITTDDAQGGSVFLLSAKRDDPDNLYSTKQGTGHSLSLDVTSSMFGTHYRTTPQLAAVLAIPVGAAASANFTLSTGSGTWTQDLVTLGGLTAALFRPDGTDLPPPSPIGTYTVGAFASGTPPGDAIAISTLTDLLLILVLTDA